MLTPEQLELRKHGVGGSEVAAIIGENPFGTTALDIWSRKIGLAGEVETTAAMDRGNRMEGPLLDWLSDELGKPIERPETTFVARDIADWFLWSPDGLIGDHAGAEAKSVGWRLADHWEAGPPTYVRTQCQWYMTGSGRREWHVVAMIGGDWPPQRFTLEDDPDLGDMLTTLVSMFWNEHVLTGTPPPIENWQAEGVREYLTQRFPRNNGILLDPDTETLALLMEFREHHAASAHHEEKATAAWHQIIERIGPNDGFIGPWGKATFKRTADSKKTDWEAIAREAGADPELILKHTRPVPGYRKRYTRFKGE